MNIADYITELLYSININTYFVVTGGAIVPFIDAIGKNNNVKYYCFQHEQSASMAAEGYYKATGKISVVLVTSGPGAQNILNGLCGCWYDSVPCLFITGQVNTNESLDSINSKPRQVGFQECNIVDIFSSCTKYCKKVQNINEVEKIFNESINILNMGRLGPICIDFPVNIQMEKTFDKFSIILKNPLYLINNININKQLIESKRPIIIIGNGARSYINDIKEWIEKNNIPFVTSWGGIDLIEHTHYLRIGSIGVYGDRVANFSVQNADLLIILGSRLDTRQTGGNLKLFSKNSIRVMVDIDYEEIKKLPERGLNIHFPINTTIDIFLKNNKPLDLITNYNDWVVTINEWKYKIGIETMQNGNNIYSFLKNISIPDNCIIIPDTGGNLVWAMQSININKTQKMFSNLGNSSMGYSLPAAIGASIATDKKIPILCIIGDGGMQMNIQELSTVYSLNLPITILIINNFGYGIIRQFQDQYFNSRYTATNSNDIYGKELGLDFKKIGEAYSIESYTIFINENDTIDLKNFKITNDSPLLYDIRINPEQKIYPKLEFGNSLENMSPYLQDIKDHMIVPYNELLLKGYWVSK